MTITLIDYGAGNLASVRKGFAAVGATVAVVREPARIAGADAIVIPGVGHFEATAALDVAWHRAIAARLASRAALLGICLGMQWLFDGSAEAPTIAGAGLFAGRCARLTGPVKIPHVGWNSLARSRRDSQMLAGIAPDASVYFTHAFAAPVTSDTAATTTHGVTFAAAVERGRVWGAQFHPEKSGAAGLRLLSNFVAMAADGR
jgi:glutamine amidotransferase